MSTFENLGTEFNSILNLTLDAIDRLSANSRKRILKKILAYPLEDNNINLNDKNKNEIFVYNNAIELQSLKFSMMIESLKQDAEEERVRQAKEERQKKKSIIPDHIEKPDYAKGE